MTVSHQAPFPKIEIYSPKGAKKATLCEKGREIGSLDVLQSYTFTEDIGSITGSFSFTVTTQHKDQKNVFDIIKPMDVIKIFEGGENPAFIGTIHQKRISGAMSERGPKKNVTITGESVSGLVSRFMLAMDLKIMNTTNADQARINLTEKMASSKDPLTIKNFLKLTWEAFTEIKVGGVTIKNGAVYDVINQYMENDFFETNSSNDEFKFPISNTFYTQGVNIITQIWQSLLPQPAYELFSRVNENGIPKIVARETPFDNKSWVKLKKYTLDLVRLTSYDLQVSDDEVYTFFYSYLVGSNLDHSSYVTISTTDNAGASTARATPRADKLDLYGYRPLEVSFNGYDSSKNKDSDNNSTLFSNFGALNDRMVKWFDRLDEMLMGSFTVITDFIKPANNPKVGCRFEAFSGEFYIKSTTNSWNYGSAPTINITVSRGAMYDNSGNMTGPVKNISQTLSELGS